MKRNWLKNGSWLVLASLTAIAGAVQAAPQTTGEWVARVTSVSSGGREFVVTDKDGQRMRVFPPARPPQAILVSRAGNPVNATALHEGDTVLLAGTRLGDAVEARRVEILTPARAGAATVEDRVFRLIGFDGGRALRATGPDGNKYRIVLPSRPQAVSVTRTGDLVNLSTLRVGDRFVVDGTGRDGAILATRVEVLDESRTGRGAAVPLRLIYRGTAGPRLLIGEGPDGSRYNVALPQRPQALYFRRNGALVEPSSLTPGQEFEAGGVLRGDRIDATRIDLR